MSPPHATAAVMRHRPLTLNRLTAQLAREDERTTKARIRAERIATLLEDITRLRAEAQTTNQEAIDAIKNQNPAAALQLLAHANQVLDSLQIQVSNVSDLRDEQAKAETSRANENDIRRDDLKAARLRQMAKQDPWRPGPGPGVA